MHSVFGIGYDPLGNIQGLNRRGLLTSLADGSSTYGMIDALMYQYTSGSPSLLTSVTETEEAEKGFKGTTALYSYDGTGNMTYASNKALSTTYSYHDMPVQMITPNVKIQNFYTSSGQKLKSVLLPDNSAPNDGPTITNYFDNIEYENSEVKAVYFDEGRAVTSKEGDYIEYFLKDHLGNTRVRISDKDQNNKVHYNVNDPANDEVMSSHHYYPFGMEWDMPSFDINGNSLASAGKDTEYTYNGKEFVDDLGIDLHDYGFRYYDPAIARFTTIDPRAEKYTGLSGYNYVANNPISFIDPRGDTLRAVNPISGQRALGLIKSGIPSPSSANNLFSLGADGMTFNSISSEALGSALSGLSADQAALVIGYAGMINGSETNVVEVVNRGEAISEYGQNALSGSKTGADLDNNSGGGYSGQAHYDGSIVRRGANGTYGIVTANSSTSIDYSNGSRRAMAGETLAHEMLGHGLGNRGGRSDGQQLDASIQAGNTYLRTQGKTYYRRNHGVSNHTKGFSPNTRPSYLSRFGF